MNLRGQESILDKFAREKMLDRHWDFDLGLTHVDKDEEEQERQAWLNEDYEDGTEAAQIIEWGQTEDGEDYDENY